VRASDGFGRCGNSFEVVALVAYGALQQGLLGNGIKNSVVGIAMPGEVVVNVFGLLKRAAHVHDVAVLEKPEGESQGAKKF